MPLKYKNSKYQYDKIKYTKSYISNKDQEIHIYNNALNFLKSKFRKFKRILDCGCGYGRSIKMVLRSIKMKKKIKTVIAIDISKKAIKKASKHISENQKHSKITFINADIESLPFKNKSFDLLISVESLPYTKNQQKALKEMKRVLTEKGILFISIENKYGGLLSDQYLSKNEIIKAIKKGRTNKTKYFTDNEFSRIIKKMGFSIIFKDKIGFTKSGIFQRFDFDQRQRKYIEEICKKDKILSNLSRGICFICVKKQKV